MARVQEQFNKLLADYEAEHGPVDFETGSNTEHVREIEKRSNTMFNLVNRFDTNDDMVSDMDELNETGKHLLATGVDPSVRWENGELVSTPAVKIRDPLDGPERQWNSKRRPIWDDDRPVYATESFIRAYEESRQYGPDWKYRRQRKIEEDWRLQKVMAAEMGDQLLGPAPRPAKDFRAEADWLPSRAIHVGELEQSDGAVINIPASAGDPLTWQRRGMQQPQSNIDPTPLQADWDADAWGSAELATEQPPPVPKKTGSPPPVPPKKGRANSEDVLDPPVPPRKPVAAKSKAPRALLRGSP